MTTYVLALIALISLLGTAVFIAFDHSAIGAVVAAVLFLCMTLSLFGIAALNKLDGIRERLTAPTPRSREVDGGAP